MLSVQERFDRHANDSRNFFNRKIGDFLYVHEEANPRWYYFFDRNGNSVMYGGRGDHTDVIVRIRPEFLAVLKPRLTAYMKELLARHGEELHLEGQKQFLAVTIALPYEKVCGPEHEVTIHTGSGCYYDQDEIAYEVMAALSGVPVYKAIAPFGSYYDFQRLDKIDDGKWVKYWHHVQGIKVEFNHVDDHSSVVVSKTIHQPRNDWEKFKRLMYEFVGEYVHARTGEKILCIPGRHVYLLVDDDPLGTVIVDIESGSSFSFAVNVPYLHEFARLRFAKQAMEMLSKEFRTE